MIGNTGGNLSFDGIDVVELARRFGTPLFVFSQARIQENIASFLAPFKRAGLPARAFYACKANSNLTVLRTIKACGLGIEVNSGGELYKACWAGFDPEEIIFNGVAKTDRELETAVGLGIRCINADSLSELRSIASISKRLNARARVALRLTPEIRDGGHPGLETGTSRSKFGMHPDAIPEACGIVSEAGGHVRLCGIHAHLGSQLRSEASFSALATRLLSYRAEVEARLGHEVEHLNMGGGYPVDYLHKDLHAAMEEGEKASRFTRGFSIAGLAEILGRTLPRDIEIYMEPGRSMVGDAAVLLSRVVRKKVSASGEPAWLLLDAGFNVLLEAVSYQWYFHMVAASRVNDPHDTGYLVGGPLCDSGDVFPSHLHGDAGFHRLLPASMKEGDIVAFLDTGAYTLEQMTDYNGRPPAMAVMVTDAREVRIIRHRPGYQELFRYDVNLDPT